MEAEIIYGDMYSLINIAMDLMSLYTASMLMRQKASAGRLIIGSSIGAAAALGIVFWSPPPLAAAAAGIIACFLSVAVAFGIKKRKKLFPLFGATAISAVFYGGICEFFFGMPGIHTGGGIGALIYSAAAGIGLILIKLLDARLRARLECPSSDAFIYFGGRHIQARLLIDTGNILTEPYFGLPVMTLSCEAASGLFDEPTMALIRGGVNDIPENAGSYPPFLAIPCHFRGGSGILFGFKPEKVLIQNGHTASKSKEIDSIVVGIDTCGGDYLGFDGLLPASSL
ncbi:MAG: sigma-E processing peptidase SpoIIGA [Oscillospiraceae bacterium]|nr:sigma-E processing peptidase SpoIIGA [Oscillospiraceae bacterium]